MPAGGIVNPFHLFAFRAPPRFLVFWLMHLLLVLLLLMVLLVL